MSGRIEALDGLRGVAILLVLLTHIQARPRQDVPALALDWLRGIGWIGVDLFFVLSGFLIVDILIRSRGQRGYFSSFYARRTLRIWPLYYATLAFAIFVAPHVPGIFSAAVRENPAWWLMFLQNAYLSSGRAVTEWPSFAPLWSLAVEEQVYLVLPVLIAVTTPRRLPWLFGAMVVLAVSARAVMITTDMPRFASYALPVARLDAFAIGGLLACGMGWLSRHASATRLAWIAGAVSLSSILAVGIVNYTFDIEQPAMQTWGYSVVAVWAGALLFLAIRSPRASAILSTPLLRAYGRYSFAIYLFHLPTWHFVQAVWPQQFAIGGAAEQVLAWALMLPLCLFGGWLSWHVVERHVLGLKRYFRVGMVKIPSPHRYTSLKNSATV